MTSRARNLLICLTLLILASSISLLGADESADTGHVVRGSVRDAITGEGLAAATVQIAGTYRGTIANNAGDFALEVPLPLPATLAVTRIGYSSQQIVVADTSVSQVDFELEISPHALPELVITPSMGRDIMRQVIARKQEWMRGSVTIALKRTRAGHSQKARKSFSFRKSCPRSCGTGNAASARPSPHAADTKYGRARAGRAVGR
jgi:hypothetical protein